MRLRREILEGAELPWGYGFAYWGCRAFVLVCYPVPLNWCVAVGRRVWSRISKGWWSEELAAAYRGGIATGEKLGYSKAMREVEEESRADLEWVRKIMAAEGVGDGRKDTLCM